jgi:phosphatidylserine/phosphatidylglycerophosphate/cardiolipin synthase-like enzyme
MHGQSARSARSGVLSSCRFREGNLDSHKGDELQRSHLTRQAGGAWVLVLALVVSLLAGAVGGSARADDPTTSPSGESAPTPDPSSSAPADPADDPGAPDPEGEGLVRQLLEGEGPVTAVPEDVVWRRGIKGSVNVGGNDSCPTACSFSLISKPAGWPTPVLTSTGLMTVNVPGDTVPGIYRVYYRVADEAAPQPEQTSVTFRVTPDSYGAPSGIAFSHPYRKGKREKIRTRILRTINSVPPGGRIQVASWSFSSKSYRQALSQAKRRGVVVQIVLAQRNRAKNSDYRRLVRAFGTTVTATGSWVKKCRYSCRGRVGTMHSKIFLFSSSYRTPYVMMTGSANLTDFAVTNQWNQMNVMSGNKPVYDEGVRVFNQMLLDRQASPMYLQTTYPSLTSYYYPTTTGRPTSDLIYKALNQVRCTGATNTPNGRTIIKIVVYAWYQDLGKLLARRVRQLWQEGCKIQIVYGISSNPVKSILYSPAGRGRIPMRQILLTNTSGSPIYYVHNKWMAIKGRYGNSRGTAIAFQGSFNFSDLGLKSDENFQALPGSNYYRAFARDFDLLWSARQARAPSPVSTITNVERTAPASPNLGTGVYRYMEND